LQTDDKGVFGCNLSDEYFTVAQVFGVSPLEFLEMNKKAALFSFAPLQVKSNLLKKLNEFRFLNF